MSSEAYEHVQGLGTSDDGAFAPEYRGLIIFSHFIAHDLFSSVY